MMSAYEKFLVEYGRKHSGMTTDEVVKNAKIAWDRANVPGDRLDNWMTDREMELSISRAAAALGRIKSAHKAQTSAANGRQGGRPTLYQQAERRVQSSPQLAPHAGFILADWPEGDKHWRWVRDAKMDEILDWVQSAR